jgi:hypothetical protein
MMCAIPKCTQFVPPTTYEEWLNCFDMLKSSSVADIETTTVIAKGRFVNKGYLAVRFQEKLVETVNAMLDRRIAQFLRDLNILISFNELSDIVYLFVKLRNEINKCLFFTDFNFLEVNVRQELELSVKTQMKKFWSDTVTFLQKQTLESCNADLEDSLFLIRRIDLFIEKVEW